MPCGYVLLRERVSTIIFLSADFVPDVSELSRIEENKDSKNDIQYGALIET